MEVRSYPRAWKAARAASSTASATSSVPMTH
jgi:hypothetical protein